MENRKIKILLIEDNVDDAELIRRKLEQSVNTRFQVITAKKLREGLEEVAKNAPDLILSDLGLPDSHGLDTVTKILLEVPHIPLVVLSGFDDEDVAIRAVQSGAQDYLVKGRLENSQLERSIYYSIERARLQVELEEHAQEVLNVQANLHKILEKSPDAIFVVSQDRRILFTNPAVESLLGRKQKELLKQPFDFPLEVGQTTEIVIEYPDKEKNTAEMRVVEFDWEHSPAYLVSMHNVTKRKKYEEDLRASEEKYRNIVELAQDGIMTVDTQGQVISCNQAFLNMIGFSEKEVVGKNFTNLPSVTTARNPEYLKLFASIVSSKTIHPIEMVWKRCDGTTKISELRASLMKSNDKIIGVQAIIIDITERKRAEETLRESEEKFSKAFLHSPAVIVISNMEDNAIIDVNETFLHLTGYTREEAIGKTTVELGIWVIPEERTKIGKILKEKGIVRKRECQFRAKSGEIHTWVISADIININNKPCMLSVGSNITERKKAEETLHVSEEKFSKAFHNSPDVIVISNIDDGTILEANETFLRLTGYTREEVIGKKNIELGTWAVPEERAEAVKTLQEKGIVSNKECCFRMKSGEIRVWLFSAEIINIDNKPCMLSVTTDITERKKMEDALRFSDAAFKSIHESVIATDTKHIVTHWNKMSEKIFGIKASQAIGKDLECSIEVVEARPGDNDRRAKNMDAGGHFRGELLHRTKRGEVWADVTSHAIEENGKRHGWVILASDITQRKLAEEALRRSEEKYRELINTSNDSIISTDSKLRFTLWNRGAEELFGYKEKEMLGQSIMTIFPATAQKDVARELIHIKKTGTSKITNSVFETYVLKKDCTLAPVDISISTRKSEGGYISTAIMRDITERRMAEEKLRESQERYRDLFENASDLIQSCDIEGKFIYVNKAWRDILGYSEKEVPGISLWDIIHPDSLAHCKQIFQKIMSGETVNNIESAFVAKDGSVIQVEGNINPVRQEEKVVATRAIFRDISVRKEAEEKLRKIDEMKSEFLSNVSHELRTPLQSISGFTKLIMNGQVPDPATQQEFFQIIDRETMHLGNLINSLLDMSRLEAGRFQLFKKLIPVRETIIDSIKMFHSLARQKNITLSEDISKEIPEMEIDNERMRQVVINLLGNAIKFSDPGTSINIKVEKLPGDLLFQMSDHGTGIREEAMKHLFERFYRAEGETVRGGTGLGLYISKQIVNAHGGRIWAESKFGEGSTFSFTLPLNGKGGNGNGKKDSGH